MHNGEGVLNGRLAMVGAALLAISVILVAPASAFVAQPSQALVISVGGGQTVVSATGCNWPEGEEFGPGSSVDVTVRTWFSGGGQNSAPMTIGTSRIVPPSAGGWEYVVPRPPLAEVPVWATEVVVEAEAHCNQAIGNGFDYDPASARRAIVRPTAPSAPATVDQHAASSRATAAEPIPGTATFTG